MESVLVLKLRQHGELTPDEEAALAELAADARHVRAGEVLVRDRQPVGASLVLLDGFACRCKDLRDGRRQISALHVPGDFVDLPSLLLKQLDHEVCMLSAGRIATVPHPQIDGLIERFPRLERRFWLSTLIESALQREQILSIGRRNAISRMAHLFCELDDRLRVVGLADGSGYRLPLTQSDLADVTGLTSVHVNRMLRELRERGLLELRGGRVEIRNRASLERLAEYDRFYLYLDHPGTPDPQNEKE